jgi:GNAT superfamily N-acetyltransferase
MRKELPEGFELDDDAGRIDVAEVHRFLSTEAYWAKGRSLEKQERLIHGAARVVGLYHDGRQIGFARTESDADIFAYLTDVYVLPEYRGRGFGAAIVRFTVEDGPFSDLFWLLHTLDAQSFYEKCGFGTPSARTMEWRKPS